MCPVDDTFGPAILNQKTGHKSIERVNTSLQSNLLFRLKMLVFKVMIGKYVFMVLVLYSICIVNPYIHNKDGGRINYAAGLRLSKNLFPDSRHNLVVKPSNIHEVIKAVTTLITIHPFCPDDQSVGNLDYTNQ